MRGGGALSAPPPPASVASRRELLWRGSLVGYRVWVMGWPGVGRRNSASQRWSSGCPGMAVISIRVGLSPSAPNASISARRSGQGGSGVSGVSSW